MQHAARRVCAGGMGMLLALTGCVPVGTDGDSLSDLVLGASPTPAVDPTANLEVEPNDSFDQAQPVYTGSPVELIGTLTPGATAAELDIWELGDVEAGDRVTGSVTVGATGDVVVGLLNEQFELIGQVIASNAIDHARTLDTIIPSAGERLYLTVGSRYGIAQPVDYNVVLTLHRDQPVADASRQAVVLNFSGGEGIRVANRTGMNIPAFDAANIEARFAGQTETVIELLFERVRQDFGSLGVDVYRDTDPAAPVDNVSTIHFGTYDAALLGLADNVDAFNADTTQTAIVYTDTFALFTNLRPTESEIAQALANVTSHEIGHLLGLRHTANPNDVMDVTATASELLEDQWFGTAYLHTSVFPIGVQNSVQLLAWTVGGWVEPQVVQSPKTVAKQAARAVADFTIPRAELVRCFCDKCEKH